MRKIYILIKKGSLLSFLICASRRKVGKRNFGYWFAQDLYSHQKGQWRTKCVGEGFANAQAFAGVAETGEGFANAQAFAGVAETGVGFANAQAFAGVAETGVVGNMQRKRKTLSPDSVGDSPNGRALISLERL